MPKVVSLPGAGEPAPAKLSDLTSFQLRKLVNMYTKASASVYERRFGLTLNEWRVISLLSSEGTLSMLRLAEHAQFDRGLTSRIVGALIERGIASREADERDARAVVIGLTGEGRRLVQQVAPVALDRNEQLLSCLTRKERASLEQALEKLAHQARVMLDIERERAQEEGDGKESAA
jgi:DNA-binding MarR family transcriptional regulator